MSRTAKLLALPAVIAVAALTAACGSDKISVPKAQNVAEGGSLYHGAVLFSERCSGCHTLNYAGAHGSASNIRTAQGNSGPNFDERCERPIDRILYAIENGGFSGAYMPQNIVVGEDAVDVARFVASYSGQDVPATPGVVKCQEKSIGALPRNTVGLSGAGKLVVPRSLNPGGNGGTSGLKHGTLASTPRPRAGQAALVSRAGQRRSS